MSKIKFGWIPDVPDKRDHYFALPPKRKLPSRVDMRPMNPLIYNQLSLGSCTAQSVAGALQFSMLEVMDVAFLPSRLFIYYNTRVLHKTVNRDSGASLRNTIKAVAGTGYCRESLWPHKISEFKVKPPKVAYDKAIKLKAIHYARVPQTLAGLKQALAENNPVVFGFAVYESFNKIGKNGMMPIPKKTEKMQGGHAVVLMGYDDAKKVFIVRNSWGNRWGDKGYFYMPYAFAVDSDYCADFWVITGV